MNRIAALQRHLEQSEESTKVEGSSLAIEANNVLAPDAGLTDMLYDYYEAAAGTLEFSAKKHGGQLVAEVFKAHGVRFVFTLSGGHVSPILVAAENIGIKVIDCRHEVTTVYAADACARIEGTCGVAVVTAGPGLTNTITAVKNAQMAESPVLLISGAAATLSKGRGALQDIEQVELLKGLCKYTATCSSVRDIVPILRKAFQQAQCGVPGPVYVEMPLDVLYPITEAAGGMSLCERKYCKDVKADQSLVSRVIIPSEFTGKSVGEYLNAIGERDAVFLEPAGKGAAPWYVSAYMKAKLRYLYANCWKEQDFSPLPVTFPTPKEYDVDETVKLLKSAKNPLLLIGSQATVLGPKMVNALASACAKLGIPVFLGGMARGLLGKGNRLHIRQNRGIALSKAGVVILAGAICDFRLGYGQQLKKSKIITINRSVPAGTMNAGLFWNPTIIAESDPGMFVCEVARKFDSNGKFDQWVGELKSAEKKTEERNKEKAKAPAYGRVQSDKSGALTRMSQEKGKELINPLSLLQVVEEILPENALLIGDGGDFVATASYILHPRGPLRWMDSGAFGTLGVGGGFALGAKLCRPDLEVWIVYGDGSSGYSLAEFDTYDRHGAPIIALIGNDASWTQIEREQVPMFGSEVSCALSYRDYDKVAIGYGGEGIKLEKPNEDEIREKLIEAQKIAKTKPVCVNALIGGTDFREGSISV